MEQRRTVREKSETVMQERGAILEERRTVLWESVIVLEDRGTVTETCLGEKRDSHGKKNSCGERGTVVQAVIERRTVF